ncbi:mandelate racemase/muconate lactonizing enzyme family protein [Pseudomonas sp. NA-150]|uniref:mandelate racemase/muconate lactonizing enzyme family protein n=1 Tax=Pseudomonas sp. NA-150 TaxID=3367525 RepID=UPI0037CA0F65
MNNQVRDYVLSSSHVRIKEVRLISIAAAPRSNWSFLSLDTDDGRTGWGELTLRSHEHLLGLALEDLRPSLIGKSLTQVFSDFAARPSLPSGRVGNALLSALDQAATDLLAQMKGVPIFELLGCRSKHPLRGYATVNRSVRERTPEGFAQATLRAVEAGYRGVKIMPFDALLPATASTPQGQGEIERALERIEAVREAVGSEIQLMVDCHWRLDEASAMTFIERAAQSRLHWVECPVPESELWDAAIARLRQHANAHGLLLAGAENGVCASGYARFIQKKLYDVVMPDIKYCGGYGELEHIVRLARENGVSVSLHNPSGPVAHMHTLHACLALGLDQPVEHQFSESPLFQSLTIGDGPVAVNGCFEVGDAAGLGISVDTECAAGHPLAHVPLSLADPSFA